MSLHLITDHTPDSALIPPDGLGRGLLLDRRPRDRLAYAGLAEPFPDSLLIPRAEWRDRIEERKRLKMTMRERLLAAGLTVLNQQRTNFCWANAPVFAMMVRRLAAAPLSKPVRLSPASVACKVTNFRNRGGWGKDALEYIVEHGVVPEDLWPANAIDRRYDTEAADAARALYRGDEWWELEPRNLDQHVSAVLRDIPCAVGLSWWRHEVLDVDFDWVDGKLTAVHANSWGVDYGDKGYGGRQGSKILADDIVAIRTGVAS